jgi:hypothetical protein
MNLCIVMEVIQNAAPATSIVIIPGTQPKTLKRNASVLPRLG